ncbi:hypothetical protein OIE50_50785 [Streptomyces canus]|uniref:hypothetical protein n=1 Tax=Streptomyces canus TaxID=58343 RepID=UPI00324F652F
MDVVVHSCPSRTQSKVVSTRTATAAVGWWYPGAGAQLLRRDALSARQLGGVVGDRDRYCRFPDARRWRAGHHQGWVVVTDGSRDAYQTPDMADGLIAFAMRMKEAAGIARAANRAVV